MPCYSDASYEAEVLIRERLKRLEAMLDDGSVKVVVGPGGSIAFDGWLPQDRGGLSDLCSYRKLAADQSWALRQAVARAEAMAGTSINQQAIASGLHSHDGGSTWSRH